MNQKRAELCSQFVAALWSTRNSSPVRSPGLPATALLRAAEESLQQAGRVRTRSALALATSMSRARLARPARFYPLSRRPAQRFLARPRLRPARLAHPLTPARRVPARQRPSPSYITASSTHHRNLALSCPHEVGETADGSGAGEYPLAPGSPRPCQIPNHVPPARSPLASEIVS